MLLGTVSKEDFISRSIAAMVALGVGDAAGDLGRNDQVRQRFGIVTELLPEGKSTDDTEFTILSARALLDNWDNFTAESVADSWRTLVLTDGGAKERGGMPLYGALWNLSRGINPPLSGRDNAFNVDDGAAMRSVPFGIAAGGDCDRAAQLAAIDASVSHDRDGIWASMAIAASITAALTGAACDEVITAGRKYIPTDSWLGHRMDLAMEITDREGDVFTKFEALHTELWTPKHSSAPEAIPQIYALFKLADGDFRKGFMLSANFGRDADTVCALTLALCAAGQGLTCIPGSWVEQVRHPSGVCLSFSVQEDLVDLAKALAEKALLSQ